VKIRGYLGPGRVFVRKDKDGKKGYSIFAPFYTAQQNLDNNPKYKTRTSSELKAGLSVDLGWVPIEHRKEISINTNPLEVITWEGAEFAAFDSFVDPYSGFEYKSNYGDDEPPQYADLTAVVRAGETWNPLVGNVNFHNKHLYQYVDLDLLSRLFLFPNQTGPRDAYLQRIVPDLEDSSRASSPR
jgi:surfeit locus 1 family protein